MADPVPDLERLMEELGRSGVISILKVDHERMADQATPWTIIMSGPAWVSRAGYAPIVGAWPTVWSMD